MNRSENVKQLEETIKEVLLEEWKVDIDRLNEIFDKYDLSKYIEVCYEMYNSMGNKGIVEDLEEYISLQDQAFAQKEKKEMYKITLYDNNCSPICDGTTFWFVENLEEFEKKWLPLQAKEDVAIVERYYRSKFGEIVTDYYSDSEELNIVQKIDCEILEEKKRTYKDKEVELVNTYDCTTTVLFDKLKILLRVIRCNDEYYLVGQYFGYGCRRIDPMLNRWYNTDGKYTQMGFYGNPVAEYLQRDINWDDFDKEDAYKDFCTNDKDFYKHEKVETFVWLPIRKVDRDYKIGRLSKEDLAILLKDIVGEAG